MVNFLLAPIPPRRSARSGGAVARLDLQFVHGL